MIPSENVWKCVTAKNGKKPCIFPGIYADRDGLDNQTQHVVSGAPGVISFVGPKNEPLPCGKTEVSRILGKIEDSKA